MRTQAFADRAQPERVSALGLEDMLRRLRVDVTAVVTRAGDARRHLRREQKPTAAPALLEIENRCLNALAVLDTVEPAPTTRRLRPWKQRSCGSTGADGGAARCRRQDRRAAQIRDGVLQLASEMSHADFGQSHATAPILDAMIAVSNQLAEIQ